MIINTQFYTKYKTSAVSTTDRMVETQVRKLRDTSDTFVGRAYSILHLCYGVCELNLRYGFYFPVSQILRKVQKNGVEFCGGIIFRRLT